MSTYPFKMMRGTNFVRATVADYLEQHLPPYIDILRLQNEGVTEITLPYPAEYMASDPFDTEPHKFPVVGTYFPNSGNYQNLQIRSDGSNDFNARYSATIFVTIRTPLLGVDSRGTKRWASRDQTIKTRDDMLGAMVACILASPSFGTARSDNRILAAYESIRTASPEPMQLNKQAPVWLCSGLINVDIDAIETVTNPVVGTVTEINTTVEKLPFEY